MNNQTVFILLSLVSGALIPVQAATNASLSKAIANPLVTGLTVLLLAFLSALVYTMISKTPFPELSQFKNAPGYSFIGGVIVAFYVIVITIVTPRLGVGAAIGLILTGQLIGALVIDHFGMFGAVVRAIDTNRVIGAIFMIAGVYLVMKK